MIPRETRIRQKSASWSAVAVLASTAILTSALNATAARPSPQDAPKAASVVDGVFSADQAKRGQATYTQACAACHQADLSGSDQAPGLAGGDFLDRWDGTSVGDLVDRIRTSMPADNVGSLTTPLSTDIVAYILQVNGFMPGQDELKADRAFQKTVMMKKK